MPQNLIEFTGAAIVVAMVPGPSTAIIVRQSVASGRRAGVMAMLGNETGVLLWCLAAAFGLSALLLASTVAYDVMRLAGAAFLVSLGVRTLWQARRSRAVAAEDGAVAATRQARRGRAYR